MTASTHTCQVAILAMTFVSGLVGAPASAAGAAPSRMLVVTGTVASLSPVRAPPPSVKRWKVHFRVEEVIKGSCAESTITFRIHSPARAGLKIGGRYTIEAEWTGQEEYDASEFNIKAAGKKR